MIELLNNDSNAFEDLERMIFELYLKATIGQKEIPSGKVGPKYKFAYRSYCKNLIDIFEDASAYLLLQHGLHTLRDHPEGL
jgi:hypothetical protein